MKKCAAILLLAAIVFSLAACGSVGKWTPGVASDDVKKYGEMAIELLEQYLNFEITESEFEQQIDDINERLSKFNLTDTEDSSERTNPEDEANAVIAVKINSLAEYGISYKSDRDIEKIADILRFNIGQKVSGREYEARRGTLGDDDAALMQRIGLSETPFQFCIYSCDEDTGRQIARIVYDCADGVNVDDIKQYALSVWDALGGEEKSTTIIYINFYRYDQFVLNYMLAIEDGETSGRIIGVMTIWRLPSSNREMSLLPLVKLQKNMLHKNSAPRLSVGRFPAFGKGPPILNSI